MTTVWIVLGGAVALATAAFGYVGWRDRQRLRSADDHAAAGAARADQERQAAPRHGAQGAVWDQGRLDGQ